MTSSNATSEVISVLIADSNRMQSQLLRSALRRHPGFNIHPCPMETSAILRAIAEYRSRVALLALDSPTNSASAGNDAARFSPLPSSNSESLAH